MPRAPLNVLVLPYRQLSSGGIEFAVFKRADDATDHWQGVAGGVELGESLLEAARRELHEETGISPDREWTSLQTRASVPAVVFACWKDWGPDVYVVEEHAFAVELSPSDEIVLSHEHSEARWLRFDHASALLRWDSNRTALWELNERLARAAQPAS